MVSQRSRWVLGLVLVGVMRGQTAAPPPPPVVGGVFGGMVQGPQPPAGPVGSVTGRVMAQDTGRAVRFAQVMLQSVASVGNSGGGGRAGGFGGGFGGNVNTQTDVDGNFTANGVAPGDYYVTAGAMGYVPETALLQSQAAAGADPAALLATVPVVHVAADSTSSVTVTLERGGTISGRVVWEDGSPAAGVTLSTMPSVKEPAMPAALQGIVSAGGVQNFARTDDRGAFRITGLTSGDYLLRAQLQAAVQSGGAVRQAGFNSSVTVYSPGVFRRSQAKAVSVREGDERSDVRMVIDLRGLHTVTGHVSSTNAGQNVASGTVLLKDTNSTELLPMGSIDANGDFTVRFVPEGSYSLIVNGASTVAGSQFGGRRRREGDGGVSFQPFTQPLTMPDSDLSGVVVMLTPAGGG